MPDPAIKEKAKEMFVVNRFSMDTILELLKNDVSRKTLYNWRNQEDWETLRRQRAVKTHNRRERLEALLDKGIDELEVNFSPALVFSIGKLVAALKTSTTFEFTEEKKEKEDSKVKGLSEENLKEIEKKLGIL